MGEKSEIKFIIINILYVLNYIKTYRLTDYRKSLVDGPESAVFKLLCFAGVKQ